MRPEALADVVSMPTWLWGGGVGGGGGGGGGVGGGGWGGGVTPSALRDWDLEVYMLCASC